MRIRPLALIASVAILSAGAAAANPPAHPTPAPKAPTCGCHIRHSAAVHVRRRAPHRIHVRTVTRARIGGYLEHRTWGGEHHWGETHGWSEAHSWGDQQGWSEGDGRWASSWDEHVSATDRYGYLTWPGKTHFVNGQPVDEGNQGARRGYPPMRAAPEGAMRPPPPEGWQDGPQPGGDEDGDGYEIHRF
jgi:hypothetical protein